MDWTVYDWTQYLRAMSVLAIVASVATGIASFKLGLRRQYYRRYLRFALSVLCFLVALAYFLGLVTPNDYGLLVSAVMRPLTTLLVMFHLAFIIANWDIKF